MQMNETFCGGAIATASAESTARQIQWGTLCSSDMGEGERTSSPLEALRDPQAAEPPRVWGRGRRREVHRTGSGPFDKLGQLCSTLGGPPMGVGSGKPTAVAGTLLCSGCSDMEPSKQRAPRGDGFLGLLLPAHSWV